MADHEENERLLTLLARYLNDTPRAIRPAEAEAIARECGITLEEAVSLLLAAFCGLNLDAAEDARLYHRYFPRMLRRLDPALCRADPYVQAIRPRAFRRGIVTLEEDRCAPMELFVADDMRRDAAGRVYPQLGWFAEEVRYPALKEGGRIWMTVTPNEINTIRPLAEGAQGKVLAYGLGLGYFAFHALRNPQVTSVTVVERSGEVIDLFRAALLPAFPRRENLRIIQADAFAYAEHAAPREGYDTVFTDLWHDVGDGLPLYRRMKALETPGPRYLYWIEPTLRCYMEDA